MNQEKGLELSKVWLEPHLSFDTMSDFPFTMHRKHMYTHMLMRSHQYSPRNTHVSPDATFTPQKSHTRHPADATYIHTSKVTHMPPSTSSKPT